MTLDYTNLDVFFHMANHYRKIRNAKSVIDCSPPKGCNNQHDPCRTSRIQQCRVPPSSCPNSRSNRFCRDECSYQPVCTEEHLRRLCEGGRRSASAPPKRLTYEATALSIGTRSEKSPTRPKSVQPSVTRAPLNNATVAKGSKKKAKKSASPERSKKSRGEKQGSGKKSKKGKDGKKCTEPTCPAFIDKKRMQHELATLKTCDAPSCSASKQKRQIEEALSQLEKDEKKAQKPAEKSAEEKVEKAADESVKKTPEKDEKNKPGIMKRGDLPSVKDHEYLYFMLRITEDILRSNKYTVEEMEKVFKSHYDANKGRLDENKMQEHIDHLKRHLNYPECICNEPAESTDECNCCPASMQELSSKKSEECICEDPRCLSYRIEMEGAGGKIVSPVVGGEAGNVDVAEEALNVDVAGDRRKEREKAKSPGGDGVLSDGINEKEMMNYDNECINPQNCDTAPAGIKPNSLCKQSFAISEVGSKRIRETDDGRLEDKLSGIVYYNPEVGRTCHCNIAIRKTALKIKTDKAPETEQYILVEGPVCMPKEMLEEKTVPVLIENVSSMLLDSESEMSGAQEKSSPSLSQVNLFKRDGDSESNWIMSSIVPESISAHINGPPRPVKAEEYDLMPEKEKGPADQVGSNEGEQRRSVVHILPNISYISSSVDSKTEGSEAEGEAEGEVEEEAREELEGEAEREARGKVDGNTEGEEDSYQINKDHNDKSEELAESSSYNQWNKFGGAEITTRHDDKEQKGEEEEEGGEEEMLEEAVNDTETKKQDQPKRSLHVAIRKKDPFDTDSEHEKIERETLRQFAPEMEEKNADNQIPVIGCIDLEALKNLLRDSQINLILLPDEKMPKPRAPDELPLMPIPHTACMVVDLQNLMDIVLKTDQDDERRSLIVELEENKLKHDAENVVVELEVLKDYFKCDEIGLIERGLVMEPYAMPLYHDLLQNEDETNTDISKMYIVWQWVEVSKNAREGITTLKQEPYLSRREVLKQEKLNQELEDEKELLEELFKPNQEPAEEAKKELSKVSSASKPESKNYIPATTGKKTSSTSSSEENEQMPEISNAVGSSHPLHRLSTSEKNLVKEASVKDVKQVKLGKEESEPSSEESLTIQQRTASKHSTARNISINKLDKILPRSNSEILYVERALSGDTRRTSAVADNKESKKQMETNEEEEDEEDETSERGGPVTNQDTAFRPGADRTENNKPADVPKSPENISENPIKEDTASPVENLEDFEKAPENPIIKHEDPERTSGTSVESQKGTETTPDDVTKTQEYPTKTSISSEESQEGSETTSEKPIKKQESPLGPIESQEGPETTSEKPIKEHLGILRTPTHPVESQERPEIIPQERSELASEYPIKKQEDPIAAVTSPVKTQEVPVKIPRSAMKTKDDSPKSSASPIKDPENIKINLGDDAKQPSVTSNNQADYKAAVARFEALKPKLKNITITKSEPSNIKYSSKCLLHKKGCKLKMALGSCCPEQLPKPVSGEGGFTILPDDPYYLSSVGATPKPVSGETGYYTAAPYMPYPSPTSQEVSGETEYYTAAPYMPYPSPTSQGVSGETGFAILPDDPYYISQTLPSEPTSGEERYTTTPYMPYSASTPTSAPISGEREFIVTPSHKDGEEMRNLHDAEIWEIARLAGIKNAETYAPAQAYKIAEQKTGEDQYREAEEEKAPAIYPFYEMTQSEDDEFLMPYPTQTPAKPPSPDMMASERPPGMMGASERSPGTMASERTPGTTAAQRSLGMPPSERSPGIMASQRAPGMMMSSVRSPIMGPGPPPPIMGPGSSPIMGPGPPPMMGPGAPPVSAAPPITIPGLDLDDFQPPPMLPRASIRRSVQLPEHFVFEEPKAPATPLPHHKRQSILMNPLPEEDKPSPDSIIDIHHAKYSVTDTVGSLDEKRNLPRVFEYSNRGQKKPMAAGRGAGEKYFEYAYQKKKDSLSESLDQDPIAEIETFKTKSDLDTADLYQTPLSDQDIDTSGRLPSVTSTSEYSVAMQESEEQSVMVSDTSVLIPKGKEGARMRYSLNPEGYDHEEIIRRLDNIPEPDRTPKQLNTIRNITQKLEDFRRIDPSDTSRKFQYSNPENFEIRRASLESVPVDDDQKNPKKQAKACCGLIKPPKSKKSVPRRN